MAPVPRELDSLRLEIEELSRQILEKLNQRTRRVLDVARAKERAGLPMRDPYREAQLLERLLDANHGPLDRAAVRSLFRAILDASVTLMEGQSRGGLRVGSDGGAPRPLRIGGETIGGDRPVYIAGPCSVETEEQVEAAARGLAALGVRFFRGGAFKPRTSPYAFQGLGEPGLRMLHDAAKRHSLLSVTEATCASHVETVASFADVIQIGARNMYSYDLLRAVGRTGKPVLLKRAFAATLDEWLNAAEYIALAGRSRSSFASAGSARSLGRPERRSIYPSCRSPSRRRGSPSSST